MDNNPSTEVVYKNPNTISEGTYIGVKYNKVINIKDIEFSLGAISNQNDTMQEAKIQYTLDGKTWLDLEQGKVYSMPQKITVDGLNLMQWEFVLLQLNLEQILGLELKIL